MALKLLYHNRVHIGVLLLCWDNGKENGTYGI